MKLLDLKEEKMSLSFKAILTETTKEEYIANAMGAKLKAAADANDRASAHHTPLEIVNKLKAADPTKNQAYLQYLANMYAAKKFKLEDASRIKTDLALFDKIKGKLQPAQRDINAYKDLGKLYDVLKPYEAQPEKAQTGGEKEREVKSKGVKVIINQGDFKVFELLNEEAAKFYGKGTKWCTAGDNDNQFNYYNKQGKIYMIMAGDRKFQYHYESDQFMDEKDESLSKSDIDYLSKFPGYKDFLNQQIHIHYLS